MNKKKITRIQRLPIISLGRRPLIRQPFYCIPPADDIHQRHTGDLPHAAPKLAIACSDDEGFVRGDALDEAVIGVSACVCTRKPLEARITGDSECRVIRE